MGRILLVISLMLYCLDVSSQGDNPSMPISWDLEMQNGIEIIKLPFLDFEEIHKQDSINDQEKSSPWRYGLPRSVSLNIEERGVWTSLDNGAKIWLIAIASSGALNISVNFDEIFLPEKSRIQIFGADRKEKPLTYSSAETRKLQAMGSWFIEGEVVWIEYYQPAGVSDSPKLNISEVIHGYRMGRVNSVVDGQRGFNDSGDCHYDVNCSIGSDFDTHKDLVKKAVALLNLGNGYLCTASLVNNTEKDKTPYLLTANHCLENSNPNLWSVRFNWVSPSPSCATDDPSGNVLTNFTMSGAELRARNATSDFALVQLSNPIPSAWDVAFAGWDNSDTNPLFEVGIHHPNGDIMKICRDDSGAEKTQANNTEVWLIGGGDHGSGNGWEIGATENGSSGSPLFNESGKIIGQLYAGQSACEGSESNHNYDLYGRFAASWDYGNSADSRLMEWLDPIGTGQGSIETLQNILSVPDFDFFGELKIYPNPAQDVITVMNSRYPNLSFEMYNTLGQQLLSGSLSNTLNHISLESLAEGLYFLSLLDGDTNNSMTKKILIKR